MPKHRDPRAPADAALWREVTRGVTPLRKKPRRAQEERQEGAQEDRQGAKSGGAKGPDALDFGAEILNGEIPDAGVSGKESPGNAGPGSQGPRASAPPLLSPGAPASPLHDAPPLAPGAAPGVDRRTAERLRRGQMAIEARIDLHGYTAEAAHHALDAFLDDGWARGLRCVLVITGKGTRPRPAGGAGNTRPLGPRHGVLRQEVPLWLNQPPNRARILVFAQAQPRDGGAGALYVLLKKRR